MLSIRHAHLKQLTDWLSAPLMGQQARVRNRFVKQLMERQTEIEAERIKTLELWADKDEDGKAILEPKEIGGFTYQTYRLNEENLAKAQEELKTYLNEELKIDVTDANREDLAVIKEIILNLETPMDFNQTEIYDEVCNCFEKMV